MSEADTTSPGGPGPPAGGQPATDPSEAGPAPTIIPEPPAPHSMQIAGGIVTSISAKEVELTLDDGRAAVIPRENFDLAGTDPTAVLQVGDGAEGAVLAREDPKDRVVLSRRWVQRDRAWKKAAACVEDKSTLHCKVLSVSNRGATVDVMGLPGFVPLNHLQLTDDDPSPELVGEMLELRVIVADREKDRLLLSRRAALLREQRRRESDALHSLKVGATYRGTVEELTGFGAFVNVNGVRGLVHVSELSWDRVTSPKGVVRVGEELDVKVLDVKIKKRRVSLSRKALLDDPLSSIEEGAVVTGTVTRLVDYGAFVDLGPAEGMVHISELAEYPPSHPSEIVMRGDQVQVRVLRVDRSKRRIELSIRQALYPDT